MKYLASLILCLASLSVVVSCSHGSDSHTSATVDSLLTCLDSVLDARPQYLAAKEARLDALRHEYETAANDSLKFYRLGDLLDEYTPFNTDSAYAIAGRREALAHQLGDTVMIMNARMNLAAIMTSTAMDREAIEIMNGISPRSLPDYLLPFYFHILRTAYGHMADHSAYAPPRAHFKALTDAYRDSLVAIKEPGSLPYALSKADHLNAMGHFGGARDTLSAYMAGNPLSEHERAICAWTLSEAYAGLGDTLHCKEQLLISSIADMRSSVREYVSLRQLALLLYSEGDLERAYRLLNISIDDAVKAGARQRIVELNDVYPVVNGIYVDNMARQQRQLMALIVVVTVLSLILVALLWNTRRQMKAIKRSRREVARANDRLAEVNSELKHSNEKLTAANNIIADNSRLKEVYIGRYMDQCMDYLEKMERHRKTVAKLLATGNTAEIKKLVQGNNEADGEVKQFYADFDDTFLKLFPTFVDDFNALLQPDEAIVPKKPGTLNTELRIFALIRLGITDSDRIAKILRYSLTTIYNYRTKVRNKAAGDRALLEAKVMEIGSPETPLQ